MVSGNFENGLILTAAMAGRASAGPDVELGFVTLAGTGPMMRIRSDGLPCGVKGKGWGYVRSAIL